MITTVLTPKERRRIQAYLDADGEKISPIRQLVTRARRYLPNIKDDIALLEKLLSTYEKRHA